MENLKALRHTNSIYSLIFFYQNVVKHYFENNDGPITILVVEIK